MECPDQPVRRAAPAFVASFLALQCIGSTFIPRVRVDPHLFKEDFATSIKRWKYIAKRTSSIVIESVSWAFSPKSLIWHKAGKLLYHMLVRQWSPVTVIMGVGYIRPVERFCDDIFGPSIIDALPFGHTIYISTDDLAVGQAVEPEAVSGCRRRRASAG